MPPARAVSGLRPHDHPPKGGWTEPIDLEDARSLCRLRTPVRFAVVDGDEAFLMVAMSIEHPGSNASGETPGRRLHVVPKTAPEGVRGGFPVPDRKSSHDSHFLLGRPRDHDPAGHSIPEHRRHARGRRCEFEGDDVDVVKTRLDRGQQPFRKKRLVSAGKPLESRIPVPLTEIVIGLPGGIDRILPEQVPPSLRPSSEHMLSDMFVPAASRPEAKWDRGLDRLFEGEERRELGLRIRDGHSSEASGSAR